jgi:hypothetical protein
MTSSGSSTVCVDQGNVLNYLKQFEIVISELGQISQALGLIEIRRSSYGIAGAPVAEATTGYLATLCQFAAALLQKSNRLMTQLAQQTGLIATASADSASAFGGSDDYQRFLAAARSGAYDGAATVSPEAQRLLDVARNASQGRKPGTKCLEHVWQYLTSSGYGNLGKDLLHDVALPEAQSFFHWLNASDGNRARAGLDLVPGITSPYDSRVQAGDVVCVTAGSAGTRHPTAGDISVADGRGNFYNGGEMGYGGPNGWHGTTYVYRPRSRTPTPSWV